MARKSDKKAELGDESAGNPESAGDNGPEERTVKDGDPKSENAEKPVSEATRGDDPELQIPNSELSDNSEFEKQLAAERDRYLRLAAEYDNFRKRSAKERETIYGDAQADAITRLLPVYDNLERALKMECVDEAYYKGVEMTMTQLTEILEGMGLRLIPAVGEPFDPNLHNAVMTVEHPELGDKIVAEEYQKGFTLGDRVIRHSTVVVAN